MPYFLDGDNLVGTARGRPPAPEERDALVSEVAERLRRTRARVLRFCDGTGKSVSLGSRSLRVAGAVSADDAIVREIARSSRPRETTVVTADRDLAHRARDAGAVTLSPTDFWKRFGASETPSGRPADTRVDVDDWMTWFDNERKKRE